MHALGRSLSHAVYRAALACVIVVGSLVFWIGIPLFWIWVAGQLTDEYPSIYLLAAAACPLTMIGWGWVLYRVNWSGLSTWPSCAPSAPRSTWAAWVAQPACFA